MRVLLVEDSPTLRGSIAEGLRDAGLAVDAVADGRQAILHALTSDYDVIVLDWMIPAPDGLTVLARLREKNVQSHILMLTARDTVEDRVRGLYAGADDYLVKPFALAELLARVRTLGRRRHGEKSPIIRVGPLCIDTAARLVRATPGGPPLDLTPREYAVVEYLALHKGKPVSRAELEEHLYDERSQVMSNAIDAAIYGIRTKLAGSGCPPLIHTRRRVGYVLGEEAV